VYPVNIPSAPFELPPETQNQQNQKLIETWALCHLFQLGGENGQCHFLSPVGSDRLVLFSLQDCQLLAQNDDF
jgi:hypothetical protein